MRKSNVYQLAVCALMAAIMCILGPIALPIGPVPISLTNLVIYITVFLLGTKGSIISYLIYLLLGAFGLPVFSGYAGGLAKLAGPTGGYLIGFVFMAAICGVFVEHKKMPVYFIGSGMVLGTAVAYLFGTIWFVVQMKCGIGYAISVCVLPFILGDLIKIVVSIVLGRQIRNALVSAKLIENRGEEVNA